MPESQTLAKPPHAIHGATFALAGVIVAFIVFNMTVLYIIHGYKNDSVVLIASTTGIWVFQPMSIGIWISVGTGPIIARLTGAIFSLIFLIITAAWIPSAFNDLESAELVGLTLGAISICAATAASFVVVRWWTGSRLKCMDVIAVGEPTGVRFSIKYLLVVTTLVAVTLGMVSQLRVRPSPPTMMFGPDFVIFLFTVGGLVTAGVLLPTTTLPWFLLTGSASKRSLGIAIIFWFLVTLLVLIFLVAENSDGFFDAFEGVLTAQIAAAAAGGAVSKFLYSVGYRLVVSHPPGRPRPIKTAPANATF